MSAWNMVGDRFTKEGNKNESYVLNQGIICLFIYLYFSFSYSFRIKVEGKQRKTKGNVCFRKRLRSFYPFY